MKYHVPKIVKEHDIEVVTRGPYSTNTGRPRGVVIHYTAGRFDHNSYAKSTLMYLASKRLGCLTMDLGGRLHMAGNQGMNDVAYHVGKSEWKGETGISRFCMGIEVCNAGKLESGARTWWGDKLKRTQWRRVNHAKGNIKPGMYHKFSNMQESALINFCLWQLDTNPEFDIDWIVGHDEIAPSRKSDPGGSLSLPMEEFRDVIRNLASMWK